jgi:hypothetical protein
MLEHGVERIPVMFQHNSKKPRSDKLQTPFNPEKYILQESYNQW